MLCGHERVVWTAYLGSGDWLGGVVNPADEKNALKQHLLMVVRCLRVSATASLPPAFAPPPPCLSSLHPSVHPSGCAHVLASTDTVQIVGEASGCGDHRAMARPTRPSATCLLTSLSGAQILNPQPSTLNLALPCAICLSTCLSGASV